MDGIKKLGKGSGIEGFKFKKGKKRMKVIIGEMEIVEIEDMEDKI